MKLKIKPKLIFLLLLFFAFFLRIYSLNWDQSNHLHPDERMITMVSEKIRFPPLSSSMSLSQKIQTIFSPTSSLNPQFFAYGSFPIYLLRFTSYLLSFINPSFGTYLYQNLVGRLLSALFDTFSLLLIFKITLSVFKDKKIAFLSALFYTLSFFPIQLSHFYAVDTLLNFFILLTLYRIILFYEKQSLKNAFFISFALALALTTKISATLLILSLGTGLVVAFLLSLKKQIFGLEISFIKKLKTYLEKTVHPKYWTTTRLKKIKKLFLHTFLIFLFAVPLLFIFQPFAFLDFPLFWRQINEQRAMTKDAFVFPYTLQYVNTTPYLYHLKNIFLWGMGPLLSLLSFSGLAFTLFKLVKGLLTPGNEESEGKQLILFSFFISYFTVTGLFAVKFMRYCLPLYPLLSILAANLLINLSKKFPKKPFLLASSLFLILHLLYFFSFFNIYSAPNTRVQATTWIENNVPSGSVILREHWDDGLPLGHYQAYELVDLPLYNPDADPQKWDQINFDLQRGDYLILASNRLYTPLSKLTDCPNLPSHRCYQKTAKYYQDLFAGKLGYQQVAEFTSYPSILGIAINDQSADESFTVYDHPKVTILKKTSR